VSPPVVITEDNGKLYFAIERLAAGAPVEVFECRIGEYADYLREDALRAQTDHVAQTWLLREREGYGIVGYMSLIADAVRLSTAEKELHKLDYPFKTIPAMKIGKLAVAEVFRQKYQGVGLTYYILLAILLRSLSTPTARRGSSPWTLMWSMTRVCWRFTKKTVSLPTPNCQANTARPSA
jgi:hypothetical protein